MADGTIIHSTRIPEDLYEKLRKLARLDERSINAEILFAIRALIAEYERKHGTITPDD